MFSFYCNCWLVIGFVMFYYVCLCFWGMSFGCDIFCSLWLLFCPLLVDVFGVAVKGMASCCFSMFRICFTMCVCFLGDGICFSILSILYHFNLFRVGQGFVENSPYSFCTVTYLQKGLFSLSFEEAFLEVLGTSDVSCGNLPPSRSSVAGAFCRSSEAGP